MKKLHNVKSNFKCQIQIRHCDLKRGSFLQFEAFQSAKVTILNCHRNLKRLKSTKIESTEIIS